MESLFCLIRLLIRVFYHYNLPMVRKLKDDCILVGSGIGRRAIRRSQDTMVLLGWPRVAIAYGLMRLDRGEFEMNVRFDRQSPSLSVLATGDAQRWELPVGEDGGSSNSMGVARSTHKRSGLITQATLAYPEVGKTDASHIVKAVRLVSCK